MRAIGSHYDHRHRRLVLVLHSGVEIQVSRRLLLPLSGKRVSDIAFIRVSRGGYYLHWPAFDRFLCVTTLFESNCKWVLQAETHFKETRVARHTSLLAMRA